MLIRAKVRWHNRSRGASDLPVARNLELYAVRVLGVLGVLLGLADACLLVDVDLLAVLGTADALFFVDADLFLDVRVAELGGLLVAVGVDGGGEGFVRLFVTFPSVCSVFRKLCFAFYLDCGRFFNLRVPIRRREDTEGDRNLRLLAARVGLARRELTHSCFKIQLAGV